MSGLTIHFDLGYFRGDGLAAESVRDAASGQDVSGDLWLRRRTLIPPISFRGRLEDRNGPGAPESGIIGGTGGKQLHAKFQRIGFGGCCHFVDERFGSEGRLWTIGIAQVSGAKRSLPYQRQAHHV